MSKGINYSSATGMSRAAILHRKVSCGVLFFSVLFLIGGCASDSSPSGVPRTATGKPRFTEEELAKMPLPQREGLPEASGGFVLAVGGETITADEVITPLIERLGPVAQANNFEQFRRQAKPQLEQILIIKVSNILLYNEAKKELGGFPQGGVPANIDRALEAATEAEVRKFIVSFGGDYAKAEVALKKMGMDWASFRKDKKKWILSQNYIASQLPDYRPVTYRELVNCYNEMKDEFFTLPATIRFRLIDIEAAKLEVVDPNQSQFSTGHLTVERARELADKLVRQIQAGEDFGELAKQYSHDHRAMFGGLWKPVQPESLAEPYDILAAEAEKIEPGQIAGPIEAGDHIFIMKLEEKRAKSFEPFEKVQKEVEAKILFDRRKQAVDELSAKLVKQAALKDKDDFIDFCLREIYRMSNR